MSREPEQEDLELDNFRQRKLRLFEEARAYLRTCADEGNAIINNGVLIIQSWTHVSSRQLENIRKEASWDDAIKSIDQGKEFSINEFTKRLDQSSNL